MTEEWVTIAVLGRPRGNKGELQAVSLSDSPGRFTRLSRVYLFREESEMGQYQLANAWWHQDRLILKFDGIDSIGEAAALEKCEVRLPFSEREPLEPGQYYQSDLIGCELVAARSGEALGRVTGCEEYGGPVLMEIDKDWLVPFTPAICREVDIARRRICVELPEGLREVNVP